MSLSQEQLDRIKKTFDLFDRNKEGTISTKDLGTAMRGLGQNPTEAELMRIIDAVDPKGRGTISYEDFEALMTPRMVQDSGQEDALLESFKLFDQDHNGYITADELKRVLGNLGETQLRQEDIDELMQEADTNGDGKINYSEFVKNLLVQP